MNINTSKISKKKVGPAPKRSLMGKPLPTADLDFHMSKIKNMVTTARNQNSTGMRFAEFDVQESISRNNKVMAQ